MGRRTDRETYGTRGYPDEGRYGGHARYSSESRYGNSGRYSSESRYGGYGQYGNEGRYGGQYDDYGRRGGCDPYGEGERPVRRRRRKKKRLRFLYPLVATFLGLAITGLLIVVLFKVQKIEIAGNQYCTDKQVREMVQNDKYSVNALYIFGKYMAGKGEVLPCFDSVTVTLKAPWHVKVSVKEKTIIGYITEGEENIYFDKDGLVIYISGEVIESLTRVEGIPIKSIKLYQQMESGDPGIFEEILETTKELKKYELTPKKLVCKDGSIYLYINNVRVSLGSTVSAEKIAQIQQIMEKLGRTKGVLHMENYSENRETITFEKKKAGKKKGKDTEKEN